MKSGRWRVGLLLFVLPAAAWLPAGVMGDAAPVAVSHHPQLFLDDYLIASSTNLHRDTKQPRKHPRNPLIRQQFPWEQRFMQVYGTVLYEPELRKYRCWYLGSANENGFPAAAGVPGLPEYFICYAESPDGIRWSKPMVGDGPRGPYRRHNIVIPDGHGISVLKTPDDPNPNRRYKAAGGAIYAFSPDGIRWEAHNWRGAVGKNDTCTSLVRWKGEYLAFVRNQEPETGTSLPDPRTGVTWTGTMRGVGLSVSTDFINWTSKRSILRTDRLDGFPWVQPHALCVTPYGDVLIGLLPVVRIIPEAGNNLMGDMEVQLVVSRDGRNWTRVADRAVFMPQAKSDRPDRRPWDLRFHPGSTMLIKDDQISIYYMGSKLRWGEGRPPAAPGPFGEPPAVAPREFGIGLATLPADRFVSLRPRNWLENGVLQTRPLRLSGRELLVNADVAARDLRMELLDARGLTIPGFAPQNCSVQVHDRLRFRVEWTDGSRRLSLRDAPLEDPVAIRFFLRNGDLYSFQTVP